MTPTTQAFPPSGPIPASHAPQMAKVNRTAAWCYRSAPLYVRVVGGDFLIFKQPGVLLAEMVASEDDLPVQIFIRVEDRIKSINEVQERLSHRLAERLGTGQSEQIKLLMVSIVQESFLEPRAENLQTLSPMVKSLVAEYGQRHAAVRELALLANRTYDTAVHAVNVSALTLAYCLKQGLPNQTATEYGLGALLHDVGKLMIDPRVLNAPRKLTPKEYQDMRRHPEEGVKLLKGHGFSEVVELAILEHHERLDGQGYPRGKRNISAVGRLIGIVDSYEALTSDERPYRRPLAYKPALELMHEETKGGKFDPAIFASFAYCLT